VNVKANFDLPSLLPGVSGTGLEAQFSDSQPPTFSQSLDAASKGILEVGTSNTWAIKTSSRQKSGSEDPKASGTVSTGSIASSPTYSQQTVLQQQVLLTQQSPFTNSTDIATPVSEGADESLDASTVTNDNTIRSYAPMGISGIGSSNSQSGVFQATGFPSGRVQWSTASIQPASILSDPSRLRIEKPVIPSSTTGTSISFQSEIWTGNAAQGAIQDQMPNVLSKPLESGLQDLTAPVLSTKDGNDVSSVVATGVGNAGQEAIQGQAPNVSSDSLESGLQTTTAQVLSTKDVFAVSNAVMSGVGNAVPETIQGQAPNASSDSLESGIQGLTAEVLSHVEGNDVSNASTTEIGNVFQKVMRGKVPNALFEAGPRTSSNVLVNDVLIKIPSSVQRAVPNAVKNSILDVSLNAASTASSNVGAIQGPHFSLNAPEKGNAAPTSIFTSTSKSTAPTVPTAQNASGTNNVDSGVAVDQLFALTQPSGGLLAIDQAGKANSTSVSPVQLSVTDSTHGAGKWNDDSRDPQGPNQHAVPASRQAGAQTGSQESTPFGDQSHGGTSSQGQNVVPAQMNFANNAVPSFASEQGTIIASPVHPAPMLAGTAGHPGRTLNDAPMPMVSVPQAIPAINTAKLIQSMGQSEMRVGMRSNEFGNISISTSATRDLISAQISLDHSGLARTLAAHLPEMQARLGSDQAITVRIDMTGEAAGQGSGTSGDRPNGSADESRGSHQEGGNSNYSGYSSREPHASPAAATITTNSNGFNARLDIRV
jgi:hypothetical protein